MNQDPIAPNLPTPPTSEERNWALAADIGALLGAVLLAAFGQIIVPLVIWLIKKDQSQFISVHARESLNANISYTLYAIGAGLLSLTIILLPVTIIFFIVLTVLWIWNAIASAIAASNGRHHRYPYILRLVK